MTEVEPLPKSCRVIDLEAMRLYRLSHPYCEVCGRAGTSLHHLKTRGSGGDDTPDNVIRLCMWCDTRVHSDADFRRRVYGVKHGEEKG